MRGDFIYFFVVRVVLFRSILVRNMCIFTLLLVVGMSYVDFILGSYSFLVLVFVRTSFIIGSSFLRLKLGCVVDFTLTETDLLLDCAYIDVFV